MKKMKRKDKLVRMRKAVAKFLRSAAERLAISEEHRSPYPDGLCYALSHSVMDEKNYLGGSHTCAERVLLWLYREGRSDRRSFEAYWFDDPNVYGRRIIAADLAAHMVEAGDCDHLFTDLL